MLTDKELGWLSGIFDGEGSATIHRQPRDKHGRMGYSADVSAVSNTDILIIQRVCELLAKAGLNFSYHYSNLSNTRHTPCTQVRLKKVIDKMAFLKLIIPETTGTKHQQARVVLSFLEARKSRGRCWKRNAVKPEIFFSQDEALYQSQPPTRKRNLSIQ